MAKKKKKDDEKEVKEVVFLPGCFDDFEGTQEELDALMKHIRDMAFSGELLENSEPVDLTEMLETGEDDMVEDILMSASENNRRRRH